MKVSLACGILVSSTLGLAQAPTRIDGRVHPELIPDNAAYRAVLLMHSHFATPEETTRSEQLHTRFAFSDADHQVYDQILRDFRLQYENLVG